MKCKNCKADVLFWPWLSHYRNCLPRYYVQFALQGDAEALLLLKALYPRVYREVIAHLKKERYHG